MKFIKSKYVIIQAKQTSSEILTDFYMIIVWISNQLGTMLCHL